MGYKKLLRLSLAASVILFLMANDLGARCSDAIGFKLGYTHSQLRAKDTGDDVSVEKLATNGMTFGMAANIAITSWLHFQPEFHYGQKGGKYEVEVPLPVAIPGFQVNVVDTRFLDYLEIPLLLKVSLPVKFPIQPTFLTGMSAGLKLRGQLINNVQISMSGMSIPYFRSEDITDQLNSLELSYIIGGGFDIGLGRGKLALDQRFSFGLKTNNYETIIPAYYFQSVGIPVPQNVVYRLQMNNYVLQVAITYFF